MKTERSPSWSLRDGDTVAVVASGFAVRPVALRRGITALRAMALTPWVGESVLARDGYLAGTDAERARDLNRALEHPRVRAVWFARGGYGTARLLPLLGEHALENRKLLIGYSDATALFAPALRQHDRVCLYAPSVAELGDPAAYDRASLEAALRGEAVSFRFGSRAVIRPGRAKGRLAGGNLTVLAHLLGTPYAPDLRDAILFLEDVGEEVYRLDRMLNQLRAAGVLDSLHGVVLGDLSAPPRKSFPSDRPLVRVLREYLVPLGVPVVRGLRVGHVAGKQTLPLGAVATLDTKRGVLEVRP